MNQQKKTVVINLWGGSGVGKSTAAAAIFAELKMRGYHSELVREYVKAWAWAGITPSGFDQPYLFGQQSRIESMLYGKLDVLVTDSPLLISAFYERWHLKRDIILPAITNFLDYAKDHNVHYLNFWLEHYKVFDTRGRYETEEVAKDVHAAMKGWLVDLGIDLINVTVEDRKRADYIIDYLESRGLGLIPSTGAQARPNDTKNAEFEAGADSAES